MPKEIDAQYGMVMGLDRDGVLRDIGDRYGLDGDALANYAHEDMETAGYEGIQHVFIGSPWVHECQLLYALVRLLQPRLIYEFGTGYYASGTHIAAALEANRRGKLVTVDVEPKEAKRLGAGARRVTAVHQSAFEFVWKQPPDFVFEDASHSAELVEHITRQAREHLPRGAFCVHHDAINYVQGPPIRAGLDAAGVDYVCYEVLPYSNADTRKGIAIWRNV